MNKAKEKKLIGVFMFVLQYLVFSAISALFVVLVLFSALMTNENPFQVTWAATFMSLGFAPLVIECLLLYTKKHFIENKKGD